MAQFSAHRQEWFGSVSNSNIFEVIMMADKDGNIINSFGLSSNINIAAGLVDGWATVHKFGAVPEMSQNDSGTIWDVPDINYPWSAFDTPGILTITTTTKNGSSSTDDDGITVHVLGLDENYEEVEDTFTISGSSATGTVSFKRVYRAYIDGAEANQTNINVLRGGTEVLRDASVISMSNFKNGFLRIRSLLLLNPVSSAIDITMSIFNSVIDRVTFIYSYIQN